MNIELSHIHLAVTYSWINQKNCNVLLLDTKLLLNLEIDLFFHKFPKIP